jgi:hypothetical protein
MPVVRRFRGSRFRRLQLHAVCAALGSAAAVAFSGDGLPRPVAHGTAPSVIAPGEHDWTAFEDTAGPASAAAQTPLVQLLESGEDLVVEIAYTDLAERQSTASSPYLTKSERVDRAYRVMRRLLGVKDVAIYRNFVSLTPVA